MSFWDSIVNSVGSMDPKELNSYGTMFDAFGRAMQGGSELAYGRQVAESAGATADQIRQGGGEAFAEAQRAAIGEEERAKLVASRALAVAAASGGGASDPTVVNMIAKIASEGAYRKSAALYRGASEEQAANYKADMVEWEGKAARTKAYVNAAGSVFSAGTTLMTGAARGRNLEVGGSMYDRFGGGGPGLRNPGPGGW